MAAVTVLVIAAFALISRATASPLPDFATEEIEAWWAGPQPGYVPGARAEDVRPLEIGASVDRRYEEQLLERLSQAVNNAQEGRWDYDAPPQLLVLLDLTEGRQISLWLSPTEDPETDHLTARLRHADGLVDDVKLTSDDVLPAVAVLIALQQGVRRN